MPVPDSTPPNSTLSVEMLQRFCDGEPAAFQQIHTRLNGSLLGFLAAKFPSLSAPDLAQNLWIEILQKRHQFNPADGPSGFTGWIFKLARYRALDLRRRRQITTADSDDLANQVTDFESTDSRRQRTEELLQMQDCLKKLPPQLQHLLHGKYWHEQSNHELAQEIDTTENQISKKLGDARKKLADCMNRKRTP